MNKFWQIYYNSVFGAIGGLVAWIIVGMIPTGSWNVHLANGFSGAGIGLFIGAALGVVEGVIIKRSFRSTLLGGLGGGLIGLFAGTAGLLLGGIVFLFVQGGLIARMLGWMALGLFLGIGQGVASLKIQRAIYGVAGGALAGLIGGALYESFTQMFLQQSGEAQVFLSAIGLTLIGASLGAIIPLSVGAIGAIMAQRGLVVILTGQRANNEIEIIGRATIGSSDSCDVYVPDRGIEKKQAVVSKSPQGFEIENIGTKQTIFVGQMPIAPGSKTLLPNEVFLQISETKMRFLSR